MKFKEEFELTYEKQINYKGNTFIISSTLHEDKKTVIDETTIKLEPTGKFYKEYYLSMDLPAVKLETTDYLNIGTPSDKNTIVTLFINEPFSSLKDKDVSEITASYIRFNCITNKFYRRSPVSKGDIMRLNGALNNIYDFISEDLVKITVSMF